MEFVELLYKSSITREGVLAQLSLLCDIAQMTAEPGKISVNHVVELMERHSHSGACAVQVYPLEKHYFKPWRQIH